MVTDLNHTPKSQWCAVRCRSKNGHKKHMCLKEIELSAQNVLTILNSIVNIVERGGGERERERATWLSSGANTWL